MTVLTDIVSEYDRETPQSQTVDKVFFQNRETV